MSSSSSVLWLNTLFAFDWLHEEQVETENNQFENSQQFPIRVIIADIDRLKEINDTFGHNTSDQVLAKLVNLFSDVFRQEDIVSRLGGDEFAILLPNTDVSIAKNIIKRIEKHLIAYNRRHMELPIYFSMGISTAKQSESLEEHLKNADYLMDEGKKFKNREIKT